MAAERDLEAAAERGAVHRRDDRLVERLDLVDQLIERRQARRAAELGDVGARREAAPGAGDHDGANGRIASERLRGVLEAASHRLRQGIHRRVVDRHQRHIAHALHVDDGHEFLPLAAGGAEFAVKRTHRAASITCSLSPYRRDCRAQWVASRAVRQSHHQGSDRRGGRGDEARARSGPRGFGRAIGLVDGERIFALRSGKRASRDRDALPRRGRGRAYSVGVKPTEFKD